jgi:DNA polymerase-3 subunit epsilon
MKLNLKNPIAFFDLETTGINIITDRIVEISIVKMMPNGETQTKTRRINPTIPISPEASAVHGIYDEDVKNEPTFKDVAKSLYQFLEGCDLGGYNMIKFDIPMLVEEFLRVGINYDVSNKKLIDVQKIFHLMEPRTLAAAYKFYCNKNLENAHSAEADTLATLEIFQSQLDRYENVAIKDKNGKEYVPIQNDMQVLHELFSQKIVDYQGRLAYNDNNEVVFNFGKYKGKLVTEIFKNDPSYYDWMMKGEFALDTKNRITQIKLSTSKIMNK